MSMKVKAGENMTGLFTLIICIIMYLAAKSDGCTRWALLVLAGVVYGIYLYILLVVAD